MPQMMPCSWLLIMLVSVLVFVLMSSNWSFFFVLFSPSYKKKIKYFASVSKFWI